MIINRENYREYIIAFTAGELNDADKGRLMAFISLHPDISEEFNLLATEDIPEELSFSNKSSLKKTEVINPSDYAEKLIALLENDLPVREAKLLRHDISVYPELEKEWLTFSKTVSVAEPDLTFSFKKELKKQTPVIPLIRFAISAAAAIAIFMVISFLREPAGKAVTIGELSLNHAPLIEKKDQTISNLVIPEAESNQPQVAIIVKKEKVREPIAISSLTATPIQLDIHALSAIPAQQVAMPEPELQPVTNMIAYHVSTPVNEALIQPEEEQTPTLNALLRREFDHTVSSALVDINKPQETEKSFRISHIGAFFLGLYNKATGNEIKITREYQDDGRLKSIAIAANQ